MTILGMHIVSRHRALIWCDSEIYDFRDKPNGEHVSKMSVNNLVYAVAVGAGDAWINDEAAFYLSRAASVPEFFEKFGKEMRDRDLKPRSGTTIALACWSRRLSRFLGFTMASSRSFIPMQTAGVVLPATHEIAFPNDADEVVPFAAGQMVEIKKEMPFAGKGVLTVAELTPEAITVRQMYDYGRQKVISEPASPLVEADTEPMRAAGG